LLGIGVVSGLAMEKVLFFVNQKPSHNNNGTARPEMEMEKLRKGIALASAQLQTIMEAMELANAKDSVEILDYQILMLKDTDFIGKIENDINGGKSCAISIENICREYRQIFAEIDNEYLNQRVYDIDDLEKRLLYAVEGEEAPKLTYMTDSIILAANDLLPSQTAELNKNIVKGILLEKGGKSSHTVILARSLGIPCIIGLEGLFQAIENGSIVIMNGKTGEVIENPSDEQIKAYEAQLGKEKLREKNLEKYKNSKAITKDNWQMNIYANITSKEEVKALTENGGEGVGLLRTEFLYMSSVKAPSEEKQYEFYSAIAKELKGKPLVIRTLDAGGDKNIEYLNIKKEENPFLGFRAIRYCLEHEDLFKAQISAILRAGVYGNVKIMFPMVSTLAEIRKVKEIVNALYLELDQKSIPFAKVELGMMVETPAAVLMADAFAKEVDFFSIGTNDLTQYIFAADRDNKKVAYLNNYYHPALLKAVYDVCRAAAVNGIHVDICGQAGEIDLLVPIWAAMGVNALSVSIFSIPAVKEIICNTDRKYIQNELDKILAMEGGEQVRDYLENLF